MPTVPVKGEQGVPAGSPWKAAFGFGGTGREHRLPSEENHKPPANYSADLRSLLDVIQVVSRRVLANRFLCGWLVWLSWILVGLIAAAAISRRLSTVMLGASSLIVAGALTTLALAWFRRPSSYALARKLDRASGLQDRLSTALYFGNSNDSDPMLLRQRRDALNRLPQADPRVLFPIRMPAFASRTLVLALVAASLLIYRVHYKAPITALVQKAANSRVEKAIVSPLVVAAKKDLLALVNREPEVQQAAADAETVAGLPDAKNGDDPSQASKEGMTPDGDWDQDSEAGNTGDSGELDDQQESDAAAQGQGQDASQAADAPQNQMADSNQPSQNENGAERGAGEQQQAGDQQSAANSVLQALKNFMKNMTGQSSSSPSESGGQPSAAGSAQQSGNSPGQGAKGENSNDPSDQKDSGASPGSKKPGGGAGNGSTPVAKLPPKNAPPPSNMVPDRVDLDANNFRQQGRIRTSSAVGIAQLPLRDIKPQPVAAIKGAEQENIPVRYRLYVQHYFEHAEKAPE